ncbi:Hypothetical predicted protein [Olea europaea subsp. europaea]|uniref:Uncharacterized protein n=1 Tax=Olea europaea subsp. europaea TaxID=158383 RepID=A0A8S0Q464_OLEEU|nr:Hypothetical predicted protein [Olea europaea subsp. europaea]
MVMDHFDDQLRDDFRNCCLRFLADVLEIQFFAQLIQALVCRGIHCDKSHELWFNVHGHLTPFGLHAGSFPEGDRLNKALEKKRLKENGGHEGNAAGDDHDDESGAGAEDNETSVSDNCQTPEGNDDDGSKVDYSRDSGGNTSSETDGGDTEDNEDASERQSGALPTPMVGSSTSGL